MHPQIGNWSFRFVFVCFVLCFDLVVWHFFPRLFHFSFRWLCFWHLDIVGHSRLCTGNLCNPKHGKYRTFSFWTYKAANRLVCNWSIGSMFQKKKTFVFISVHIRGVCYRTFIFIPFYFGLCFSFFHTPINQTLLLHTPRTDLPPRFFLWHGDT